MTDNRAVDELLKMGFKPEQGFFVKIHPGLYAFLVANRTQGFDRDPRSN